LEPIAKQASRPTSKEESRRTISLGAGIFPASLFPTDGGRWRWGEAVTLDGLLLTGLQLKDK